MTNQQRIQEADSLLHSYPKDAYGLYIEAMQQAEKDQDLPLQGRALIGLAHACRSLTEIPIGFKYAFKALNVYGRLQDPSGLAKAENFLGIFYFYSGLHQKAIYYFTSALKQLEQAPSDLSTKISILNNIGEVYRDAGAWEESLPYYQQALVLAETNAFSAYRSVIASNIGDVYYHTETFDQALAYFKTAVLTLDDDADPIYRSEGDLRLAKVYMTIGQDDLARHHLALAENTITASSNRYYRIDLLKQKYLFTKSTAPEDARPYLLEAEQLSHMAGAEKKRADLLLLLTEDYESTGAFQEALATFKEYHEVHQAIEASHLQHRLEIMRVEAQMPESSQVGLVAPPHHFRRNHDMHQKEELTRQALYDELTALPNRRLINLTLSEMDERTPGVSYWLAMLDLDHFKWVNDGMGHLYGDSCLVKIAAILETAAVSHRGFAARYGGEEFLMVFPGITREAGDEILKSIHRQIQESQCPYRYQEQDYRLTASIGAVYNEDGAQSSRSQLELADRALYQAKKQGRNRIVIAD